MRLDIRPLVNAPFALAILSIPLAAHADGGVKPPSRCTSIGLPVPPYNPYPLLPGYIPPSILPPNINSEIART